MKAQVNSFKVSLFSKIVSLKLVANSSGNSPFQFLVIIVLFFHCFMATASAGNININFERRNLTSGQRSHHTSTLPDALYVQLCTYLIDSPFLNQKKFEYLICWNINIWKNKFLYEKINDSVGWSKQSGEQH